MIRGPKGPFFTLFPPVEFEAAEFEAAEFLSLTRFKQSTIVFFSPERNGVDCVFWFEKERSNL